MEDADAVQIDAPLPPQGQTPLPQPDPFPPVAHRAARQPRRKEKGGEQQGHGQAGQGGAGDEGEQGAEGKGCSGGSKKDETALFRPGQKVRRDESLLSIVVVLSYSSSIVTKCVAEYCFL